MIRVLLLLFAMDTMVGSPPGCSQYGCPLPPPVPRHEPYLPAPPGKSPSCAMHGRTYCEHIDRYPTHVIHYLVERWIYDYNTLFSNERREIYRPEPLYGPPAYHHKSFPYGPKQLHQTSAPLFGHQALPTLVNTNFNQTQVQNGYPDRRYPLRNLQQHVYSDDPGFIYSALLQPNVTPYNENQWWKRYSRSSRTKRQSGVTTLCPTISQFIMPRAAVNNQGNWKYVVNLEQNQKYTQLVQSETCISRQCNGICSLPNGYTSSCAQQFVQKRLVALDGTGERLYTDVFWLPHCCICQIQLTA